MTTRGRSRCRCCHGAASAEAPLALDGVVLHRLAFMVWHAALHLSQQHSYDAGAKNQIKSKQPTSTLTTQQPRKSRCGGHAQTMDLSYVTERIIALWFPADVGRASYRQGQQEAAHMLHTKHGDNYMVFNLSESRRALRNHHQRVRELGWAPGMAPPLERLCAVCKDIDSWLGGGPHRMAVLHARGGKESIAVVIAAYMHYTNICGSADQALDRFAMARFLQDKLGDLDQPSHRRYVEYFAGLLSASIRINAAPLYLTHVTVLGAPSFLSEGGCRAFLKVYEGLVPVYTSGVHTVGPTARQFTVGLAGRGLPLRGDVLLRCYHRQPAGRELVFACQFHTCAVADYTLSFTRQQLDHACNDLRFPLDGAVELHFSPTPEVRHPSPAPTPAVPVDNSDDPVTRWDSYENLSLLESPPESDTDDPSAAATAEVNHTYGPLDGSLYATIGKKQQEELEAVASPHTVSMDSGISSAGNGKAPGGTAAHAPCTKEELSPEEQHRALDELLNDMLLTVENIPDLPPPPQPFAAEADVSSPPPEPSSPELLALQLDNGFGGDDADIPYHARQDSRPFTYGAIPQPGAMLASPSLVRKASFKTTTTTTSSTTTPTKVVTTPRTPASPPTSDVAIWDYRYSNGGSSSSTATSPRSPEFHDGTVVGTGNLTWLQRQQQKLRERREGQLRSERLPHETRLLSELRSVQRSDGYVSDQADLCTPLHINTVAGHKAAGGSAPASPLLPHRVSSRRFTQQQQTTTTYQTLGRQKSDTSFDRERPFVAVKRSHEQGRKSPLTSPQELMSLNLARQRQDNDASGLLTTVDGEQRQHSVGTSGQQQEALMGLNASLEASFLTNNSYFAWPQIRDESYSSWRTTSVSDEPSSPSQSNSPRPQTPAFPVHPRTPYVNNSSQQFEAVSPASGLPPKSPTTQRRLSFSGSFKNLRKWPSNSSVSSKDRSPSPVSDHSQTVQTHNVSIISNSSSGASSSSRVLTGYQSTTPHSSGFVSDSYLQQSPKNSTMVNGSTGQSSPTVYYGHSRRSSVHSNSEPPQDVSPAHVKFVRDTSRFWYKPTISREEAINMLRDQPPGTFVVRDSNSFPGAFGLALKVATPPPNIQGKNATVSDPANELVRHFLIEPTSRGVKLKGCSNEPVFSSLSALVYQHSLMPMALPCRLLLPEGDGSRLTAESPSANSNAQQLLAQGAACNVLYLFTMDTESLTGPQAVKKTVQQIFSMKPLPQATIVHFKVSGQGITLTDNKRQLFFRRHYPVNTISYCGLDPDEHRWSQKNEETGLPISSNRCFGFVARKQASKTDNQCHIFAELEPEQPASAIVNFVSKVIMNCGNIKANIV